MEIYNVLKFFLLSYTGFVVLFHLFVFVLEIKYKSHLSVNHEIRKLFDKVRGKKIILLPLRIITYIFLVCCIVFVLPWIIALIMPNGISWIAYFDDANELHTWIGTFSDNGNQSNFYFIYSLISLLGLRGFWLIDYISRILSDTSLVVGPRGIIHYKKELRLK